MIAVDLQFLPRESRDFQQPPAAAELSRLARRLLRDHAPPVAAVEVGGGMFNHTFRVTTADGRAYALRCSPPYDHPALFSNERHLLRREHALTAALAPVLRERLPKTVGVDFTGELLPRDALLAEWIDGENWEAVKASLSAAQNDAVWRELGGLLRMIHAETAPAFGWCEPERPHASWSGFLFAGLHGLLADHQRLGIDATEGRAFARVLESGADWLDEIRVPRLVHGDPWPKNVLIRREGDAVRIVALLDHERGLFGDPMNEWVFHRLGFPAPFWSTYGAAPAGPAAEFRALAYGGIIDVQVVLEGWRYHHAVAKARQRLLDGTARLQALRAEAG